jgi:hypothetical protein
VADARSRLFDLAVNRAAEATVRLGAAQRPDDLRLALEVWYLKTRFANRVPFDALLAAVASRPAGAVHWTGGETGGWRPGAPPVP